MLRAVSITRAADRKLQLAFDSVVLPQDERHLRRKVLTLSQGEKVLVDLPEPVVLGGGDLLVLEDGRCAGIVAAEEELYEVRARDAVHLVELAWHLGNRHLAAQVEAGRILILRDHVIKGMLEGLGASVVEVFEPFSPLRGAYSGHSHGRDDAHHGNHHHD
ncbi:urease accessory protein UreE [Mesorhizobium sp. BAC0120]|uniref:urease accessory protein UreE n=1 Tax=Mesorhizobium sp. BAC0120 TaxID=3090670 RepID=UPI00298D2368|nr:urease accessory protein UreE [Mesorhizobium sp. BAC0120]MDW6024629.1 urease accessory protein UreE [Mesorhizobium sp. BAC0120]